MLWHKWWIHIMWWITNNENVIVASSFLLWNFTYIKVTINHFISMSLFFNEIFKKVFSKALCFKWVETIYKIKIHKSISCLGKRSKKDIVILRRGMFLFSHRWLSNLMWFWSSPCQLIERQGAVPMAQ